MAITMAGMGSRFAKAGHTRPKYEIEALGRPLFDWSMLSLTAFRDAGWTFRFATRASSGAPDYLRARCAALGLEVDTILELDGLTDGQATTALMLAKGAPTDAPFAIYNIDTFVAPGAMVPPDPKDCAGWIPCFAAPGDGWSFARIDADGRVAELREKVRISNHATVGLYWFEAAGRYVEVYRDHFTRPDGMEKGERYVAPMYNRMIEAGETVRIAELAMEDVGMLGTPEQVDDFIAVPPTAAAKLRA
jgi:hypothetical protein